MLRRDFVQRLPVVTTGVVAGVSGLSLSACAGVPYLVPSTRPGGISIASDQLDSESGVFLQTPAMERPVFVWRESSGDAVAVLASCTHRGCQPEPVGDRLVCPCHGSEFSMAGEVLAGPAEDALTRYEVMEEGGELIVRLEPGGRR